MKQHRTLGIVVALVLLVAACGDGSAADSTVSTTTAPVTTTGQDSTTTTQGTEMAGVAASDLPRRQAEVSDSDFTDIAAGDRAFAADLYGVLSAGDGNLVFSPTSIRLALAMAYAGAEGGTAGEMAQVLHFDLPAEQTAAAMNALDAALASRNREEPPGPDGVERKVIVDVANSLWGQQGLHFEQAFLDTLATQYGAGLNLADFVTAAEAARVEINDWVADHTNGIITDLIPQGALNELTRLVLVNAVYLDATWMTPFEKSATADGPFVTLDGTRLTVPVMHGELRIPYGAGDGWQAVELPYVGDELAMMLIVPDEGRFADAEAAMAGGLLDEARDSLSSATVRLGLPKYEFRSQSMLSGALEGLGMTDAFDPNAADFSGMTTDEQLYIADVIHEAYISVDEEGTEAAAATAVVMGATAMPVDVVHLEIDRPFIFALQDRATGAVLFLGRVVDPTV